MSKVKWLGATLFIAALVAVRYLLFSRGALYTDSDARWSNWIVVGVASLIVVILARSQSRKDAIVVVSGAAAFISAAIGIGSLAAPTTPRDAIAPACAGAAVAGGQFLATTSALGANGRGGPDESFPQVKRFGSDCTLSFDGYCIGQPELDSRFGTQRYGDLDDDRWLILHQATLGSILGFSRPKPIFVAAGVVQAQSPESSLGSRPTSYCPSKNGWTPPGLVSFKVRQRKNGSLELVASAPQAVAVGIGVILVGHVGGGAIHRLSRRNAPFNIASGISARAHIPQQDALAPSGPTEIIASVCYAPNVQEPDNYQVVQISQGPRRRFVIKSLRRSLHGETLVRAQVAACSTT